MAEDQRVRRSLLEPSTPAPASAPCEEGRDERWKGRRGGGKLEEEEEEEEEEGEELDREPANWVQRTLRWSKVPEPLSDCSSCARTSGKPAETVAIASSRLSALSRCPARLWLSRAALPRRHPPAGRKREEREGRGRGGRIEKEGGRERSEERGRERSEEVGERVE
eukprot:scaffold168401_cov29-Tisochrysis_lutea.AAC.1